MVTGINDDGAQAASTLSSDGCLVHHGDNANGRRDSRRRLRLRIDAAYKALEKNDRTFHNAL